MKGIDYSNSSSNIIKYACLGALSYFIAGIFEGLVLLRYEAMLGFPTEGIIGGLIFGLFISKHFSIIRTIVASLVAIVVGLFAGTFIALIIYDGYLIPSIVSGLLVGAIFSLIMGARSKFILFAIIAAIVFVLGDIIVDNINAWQGGLYNAVTDIVGDKGYMVFIVALTTLYHGIAIGLGTGVYLKVGKHNKA